MVMRVLIVDDDPDVRRALQRTPEWETRTSATIPDGILETRQWYPGVVLLDNNFLGSDEAGIDAVAAFLSASQRRARVIVMTGAYSEDDGRRAIRNGAFAYLEKGSIETIRYLVRCAHEGVPFVLFASSQKVH